MRMFKSSDMHKHVLRPDGSIRVCTKAAVGVEDDEVVLLSATVYTPGKWFYDKSTNQMIAYTPAQLQERRRVRVEAADAERSQRRKKLERLTHLMAAQSSEIKEALELIADLSGLKTKKGPDSP
jgi:ABC-type Mn2+/Zn2+ transport system ATPase subunit